VHEPEVSLFPNWVRASMVRKVALVEPHLELDHAEALPSVAALTAVLKWERIAQPVRSAG